ncbi:MAG: sporulation initiation factor Spo0A C-terminal domain-containing protein [Clostridia bacterium]|nr:sporulation initiation factor Spo0A C-terminal domain-containing protein [Clostridia bacterium]
MYSYELLYKKEPTLDESILKLLEEMSVPGKLKGHKYLAAAIRIAVDEPETVSAVTKMIYPRIAEAYDTNVACVESAIRTAITKAWYMGDMALQYELFGHTVRFMSGRPGEAEFIAILAQHLRTERQLGRH